jgi:hypothetical protein
MQGPIPEHHRRDQRQPPDGGTKSAIRESPPPSFPQKRAAQAIAQPLVLLRIIEIKIIAILIDNAFLAGVLRLKQRIERAR